MTPVSHLGGQKPRILDFRDVLDFMNQKNPGRTAVRNWANGVLVLLFVACFPLGFVLPQVWSWENHVLEMVQNVVLALGCVSAVWFARQRGIKQPAALAMLIASFFWLGFLGRELSWGAVLMPSTGMTQWGPSFIGHDLWWKPFLRGILVVLALLGAYWFFAKKLWGRVIWRLAQERAWPVGALLVYAACMVTTINAEGHGFVFLQGWYGLQVMVLEELVESVGYLALLWAQCLVMDQMRRWPTAAVS